MIKPWTRLGSKLLLETIPFDVYSHRVKSPNGLVEEDFFTLTCKHWVNVVALTTDNKIVLVEQYRHGVDSISLELPGGMIDEGEDPLLSGKRELLEETGYEASEAIDLGWTHPNPAILSNQCFFYALPNVELTSEQNLDHAEEIKVHTYSLAEASSFLSDGKITHALSALGLSRYLLSQR